MWRQHASASKRRQPGLEPLRRLREPAARGIDEVHMLALLQAEHQAGHQGGAGAVQAVDQPQLAVLVLQPRLPLAAPCLCRRRLRRAEAARQTGKDRRLDNGDCQTLRHRQGLRDNPPPMGGRAHFRMAEPMPEIGERLGKDHRQCRGVDHNRPHPPRHPKPRKIMLCLIEFRVGRLMALVFPVQVTLNRRATRVRHL